MTEARTFFYVLRDFFHIVHMYIVHCGFCFENMLNNFFIFLNTNLMGSLALTLFCFTILNHKLLTQRQAFVVLLGVHYHFTNAVLFQWNIIIVFGLSERQIRQYRVAKAECNNNRNIIMKICTCRC